MSGLFFWIAGYMFTLALTENLTGRQRVLSESFYVAFFWPFLLADAVGEYMKERRKK